MIRVGPAGWSYPDWEGIVYPRHRRAAFHPLRHLAHFVDCVEINSTFYALPAEQHVVAWTRVLEGRPEFVFTAKLHRDFTHGPWPSDESHAQRLAQAFEAALAPLRSSGRLKALLAQFPVTASVPSSDSTKGLPWMPIIKDSLISFVQAFWIKFSVSAEAGKIS